MDRVAGFKYINMSLAKCSQACTISADCIKLKLQWLSLFILLLFISTFTVLRAQSGIKDPGNVTDAKGVIYKTEWSIDAALHTNGFYLGYNSGKIKNYHTTQTFHADIGFLYHPLETSSNRPGNIGFRTFNSYVFGKKNQLINFRLGKGIIKTLSEKARTKGIAIGLRLEGGIDIGLLKPYYIKVLEEFDGNYLIKDIRYTDDPEAFIDPRIILGGSGFFKGFGQSSVVLGAFGRAAFRFDVGAYERLVKCLEIGLQLDLYSKSPDILVGERNPFHFLNFYLNLQLGSRKP